MKETGCMMSRSGFIKGMVASMGVVGSGRAFAGAKRPVRFGVVTDSHYSGRDRWSDRHYRDSLAKMRQAVDAFNGAGLDFAIELGDMKDMGVATVKMDGVSVPRPKEEVRAETIGCLGEIEAEFAGKGYGDFKLAVGEVTADALAPVQNEFNRLMGDKAYLEAVMKSGAEQASYYARKTLSKVRRKIGFVN